MVDKNKEDQKQSLAELQQELKSLKALLLSRGPGGLASSPSSPLPALTGRPSIPSWQLANSVSSLASSESPRDAPLSPPNGKGKQVELSS
jgi:peroxin-14